MGRPDFESDVPAPCRWRRHWSAARCRRRRGRPGLVPPWPARAAAFAATTPRSIADRSLRCRQTSPNPVGFRIGRARPAGAPGSSWRTAPYIRKGKAESHKGAGWWDCQEPVRKVDGSDVERLRSVGGDGRREAERETGEGRKVTRDNSLRRCHSQRSAAQRGDLYWRPRAGIEISSRRSD